jgi:glutaminase
MERCEKAAEFVDFDTFRYLIDPAILLAERALYQRLAVPKWSEFTAHLDHIFDEAKECTTGDVAHYIPELARVDPSLWGMSFCSIDGQQHNAGDTKHAFSVQSAGKPLTYLMAMEHCGEHVVHRFVGRGLYTSSYVMAWHNDAVCSVYVEPSGRAFNELSLNHEMIPHNPLINRYIHHIIVTSKRMDI